MRGLSTRNTPSYIFAGAWLLALSCSGSAGAPAGDPGEAGGGDGSGGVFESTGGTAAGGGDPGPTGGIADSGGTSSSGGNGGAGAAPGGGPSGSGGESPGSGGAPQNDLFDELVQSFDAYWDFEEANGAQVPPVVGSAHLELEVGTLDSGPTGKQLTLSSAGTGASAEGPVVDTSASFSIAAWVKLDALDAFNTFVSISGTELSAAYLQKRDSDRLAFATFPEDSTSSSPCVTSAEIKPRSGEWYHVAVTRDAATRAQRIYVDGVLSGKSTCPAGVFAAPGPLRIGSGLWAAELADFSKGAVDGVGVTSRVLSPSDVLVLYRAGRPDARHYLFAYFVEVTQGRGDGLRLAHSHDGLHFGAIGGGKVFMPPSVGGGSFRDPHVMRDPDGLYHLVWTTSCVPWAEANCVQDRGFGHASSLDLVNWSAADYLTIDLNVEHVWAPETYYDAETKQYMVFFSSPIDSNPQAADPHSLYYVLTSDFKTHTAPEILYSQPGRNFIDGTILRRGDEFLMILKDEADGQKNLRALSSPKLFGEGAWLGGPSAPLTGNYAAEGPSLIERDGELLIYFDKYGEGAYGALRARTDEDPLSPASWEDISASVFFPGVRHGTPIEVPWSVFEKVALAAGETED